MPIHNSVYVIQRRCCKPEEPIWERLDAEVVQQCYHPIELDAELADMILATQGVINMEPKKFKVVRTFNEKISKG